MTEKMQHTHIRVPDVGPMRGDCPACDSIDPYTQTLEYLQMAQRWDDPAYGWRNVGGWL